MHHRPVALVSVLAVGDYLLWNWSLQGSHDVLALISGLTLVLLAIALIWLVALNAGRLLARFAQRKPARAAQGATRTTAGTRSGRARSGRGRSKQPMVSPAHADAMAMQQHQGGEPGKPASSSKLAA